MLDFSITYADASDRRIVRREVIAADDIDVAARRAIDTCPREWFVAGVVQSDVLDADYREREQAAG